MFSKIVGLSLMLLGVDGIIPVLSVHSNVYAMDKIIVNTQADLIASVTQAQPGDAIIIKDGTYSNWSVIIKGQGSEGKPIIIKPETKGGVIFTGDGIVKKTMFDI